jgi:UDP-glucose 4-epimerase
MPKKKVILVTGVASYWGYRVSQKLLEKKRYEVIGVDRQKPDPEIKGLDFIQADIRNPLMVDLFKSEDIDTVCHLLFSESLHPNEFAFDNNVLGSIKTFGACAEAGVRKIITMSSTMVYGARPTNPGFISEDSPLNGSTKYGYIRDLVEIEAFCNGFRRQHSQIIMTTLRFPHIIGPTAVTPLTRYLSTSFPPVLLGFEPMIQIIHEKDVIRAFLHVIDNDHPGVFNIAAEGVFPLMRVLGMVGKTPLPVIHLLAYWGVNLFGAAAQKHLPIDPDYLRFRWVADLTRMRKRLGFLPSYTAEEALREFSGELRTRAFLPESTSLAYDEERLRDTIERRQRDRAISSPSQASSAQSQGKKT